MTNPLLFASLFSDLKVEGRRIYRDKEKTTDLGGFPTDNYEITFICPACGPPFSVAIKVGPGAPDASVPRWHADVVPYSKADWAEIVTIRPSINNTQAGHGPRHASCCAHFSIIAGKVVRA